MNKDHIVVAVPNKPEYVSLVRLTSSSISNNMGFDFDDIDDIKVAVAEACNNLILSTATKETEIKVEFWVGQEELVICITTDESVNCQFGADEESIDQNLSLLIIRTIMDEVECIQGETSGIKMIKKIGVDA